MRKILQLVIPSALSSTLLFAMSSTAAHAAAPFSTIAIEPSVGTTGLGIELIVPVLPDYLNFNIGYSGFAFTYHTTSGGQPYRADFRMGGAPIYFSGYPFGSRFPNFHLDLGMFVINNRIELDAQPSGGVYVFNGHTYTEEELGKVTGHTHLYTIGPYFGFGWGNPFLGGRWKFNVNAGVILEGGPDAQLRSANENQIPGALENISAAQRTFNRDITFLKTYPVVNIGVTYRF